MDIGTILIYTTLGLSIFSVIFLALSAAGKEFAYKIGEKLFYFSGISITLAVILLFVALINHSFEFNYVYQYSSRDLPFVYLITAFWAGQEGTFLLWIFLLFIFGCFVIRTRDENLNILLGMIVVTQVFIVFILCIRGPFEFVWDLSPGRFREGLVPMDGSGLNPLLQDPWMVIHPPVLFLGYAAAVIPFAYAIAGLLKNDYKTWISNSYKWILFCMSTLGIGIFLGGYWAYKVLGWGGYWGWDPVENSSLIPWLFMVALMHGIIIQKKKDALIKTNIFLALITFILVLYSTFLTRSGILADFSVHSFADLGLSRHLIVFILFYIVIGAILFIKRFREIESKPLSDKIFTSDNIINYGIITLSFYSLFILAGTSMPILSNIFLSDPSSVTAKFYNNISIPLGILILVFIGLASIYQFPKKMNMKIIITIFALSLIAGILLNISQSANVIAYIFIIVGFFIVIQNIIDIVKYRSGKVLISRLAHLGVGIFVVGLMTSNIHSYSIQKKLPQNIEKEVQSVKLTFRGITESKTSKLQFTYQEGESIKDIEAKYFFNKKTNSIYKEPYISYGLLKDVYISPIEYKSGADRAGNIILAKGEMKEVSGIKMQFMKFNVNKEHMKSKNPELYVKINMNLKGKNYLVEPGVRFQGKKNVEKIDAKIPGTNRRISLISWDIRNKKINLYVDPVKGAPVPTGSVIVEVSFKRLIWFVWLGTILISISSFLAIRRSLGKAKSY